VSGWLLGLALFVCSCGSGGESGPTEPDLGGGPVVEERVGAVYLSNETPYPLHVSFLNTAVSEDIYIVRTTVAVGARVMVSGGELPAGYMVEIDFVLQVPAEIGPRVRRKASVHIDGDVALLAHLQEAGTPFSLAIKETP